MIKDFIKKNRYESICYAVLTLLLIFGICFLFVKNETITVSGENFTSAGGVYDEASDSVYASGEMYSEPVLIQSCPLSLTAGVYKVSLFYKSTADRENLLTVNADKAAYNTIRTNPVILYSGENQLDYYVYITQKNDSVRLNVNWNGNGELTIMKAELVKTNILAREIIALTVCALLFVCLLFTLKRKNYFTKERLVYIGALTALCIFASVPLFNNYIISGGDCVYHLLRVEGVKDALLSGQFPIRIFPEWLFGYGYADATMYGHTFLLIPGILRAVGFSMLFSYKAYLLIINICTVLSSYICFSKIFKDKKTGLMCSYLYTLVPYRIFAMYLTSILGMFTAALFLPVILLGMYRILAEDTSKKEYRYNCLILAFGVSGVLTNHMLSTEIAAGFIFIFCIIFIKRVFNLKRLAQLVKALGIVVLANLWFIVPFIDMYMSGNLHIKYVSERTIQERGVMPTQFFALFPMQGGHDIYGTGGMNDATNWTVGIALTLGLLVFVWILLAKRDERSLKEYKLGTIFFGAAVFTAFACSIYFPWDYLHGMNSLFAKLVSSLQFPTRILMFLGLFLSALTGCIIMTLKRDEKLLKIYTCAVVICSFITALFCYNEVCKNGAVLKIYDGIEMGSGYTSGGEYLPENIYGISNEVLTIRDAIPSDNISISNYRKDGLSVTFDVVNESACEGYVDVPMLNYPGYKTVDENNNELVMTNGTREEIRVLIPAGSSHSVHTYFAQKWYWNIATIISALAVMVVFVFAFIGMRRDYIERLK